MSTSGQPVLPFLKNALFILGVVTVAIAIWTRPCEGQVTANVLRRVLLLQTPAGVGTAFTVDVDARQYIITAKHLVKGLKDEDKIHIRKNEQWSDVAVKIFRCDDPVDIAVLVASSQLTVNFPMEPDSSGFSVGGDAFFVGFPYGLQAANMNALHPLGLVKKATLSAFERVPGKDHGLLFMLDGYNNPGFSGSPLVIRDVTKSGVVYKVAGVVVSFRFEAAPVLKTEEVAQNQITPNDITQSRILEYDGKLFRITQETTDFVKLNTGIASAYDILFAMEIIHQHPIGPKSDENWVDQ
jgi:hypothetical protein